MDISKVFHIAAAGMNAQSSRLRVVSENIANSNTLADTPAGEPYRRKLVTFANVLDTELGINKVEVSDVTTDRGKLAKRYEPSHPAADEEGFVTVPNVNPMIEMMDLRQAQRAYEANLSVIEVSRGMVQNTIELLRV